MKRFLVGMILVIAANSVLADDPGDVRLVSPAGGLSLPDQEVPDPRDVLPPASARSQKLQQDRIRAALDGKSTNSGGDEALGDVLRILKKRGSVLEGSSLDSDDQRSRGDSVINSGDYWKPKESRPSKLDSRRPSGPNVPYQPSQLPQPPPGKVISATDAAKIAESLLRAARMLESQFPDDPTVKMLRHRAVELLQGSLGRTPNRGYSAH